MTSPDHEQISSKEITSDWCEIHFPRDLRVIYAEFNSTRPNWVWNPVLKPGLEPERYHL